MMSLIDQSATAPGCSIRVSPIWLRSASHCRYSSRTPFNSSDLFIDASFCSMSPLFFSRSLPHICSSKKLSDETRPILPLAILFMYLLHYLGYDNNSTPHQGKTPEAHRDPSPVW